MYFNVNKGRYPVVKLDNQYCLFSMCRIDPGDIPPGLHRYELRGTDAHTGSPVLVQPKVPDPHCLGTLLTKEELPLDTTGQYRPEQLTVLRQGGEPPTVEEFLKLTDEELDQDKAGGFLYHSSFGLVPVYPHLDMYCATNNLYMGLYYYDEEEQYTDHFGDVTVNLTTLPYLYSAIDTNNNGTKILDFLERSGFGTKTEYQIPSGFCSFPVFQFQEEALRAIDPDIFSEYARIHGHAAPNLDDKIQDAEGRASNTPHKHTPSRGDSDHSI